MHLKKKATVVVDVTLHRSRELRHLLLVVSPQPHKDRQPAAHTTRHKDGAARTRRMSIKTGRGEKHGEHETRKVHLQSGSKADPPVLIAVAQIERAEHVRGWVRVSQACRTVPVAGCKMMIRAAARL